MVILWKLSFWAWEWNKDAWYHLFYSTLNKNSNKTRKSERCMIRKEQIVIIKDNFLVVIQTQEIIRLGNGI